MTKTNKLVVLLAMLTFAVMLCLTACETKNQANDSQSEGASDSTPQTTATLVISNETLNIEEDDTFTLTVSKSDDSEVGTVVWTSSDPSVATVDAAGQVTAILEGNTTVTATCDGLTATCEITVYASEDYPVLELSRYNAVMLAEDQVAVTASATYKGAEITLTALTANSGNDAVVTASVEGTTVTLTAVAYGETTVTVSSTYKNKPMSRNVTVKVNEDVTFTLDETAELYTYAYGELINTKALTASVTVNGTALENAAIEWSVDDDAVLSVENGTITAIGVGEATVTAKYLSTSGIEYTQNCTVTVKKTVVDLGTQADLFLNTADGDNVLSLSADLNAPALSDLTLSDMATGEAIAMTEVEGGYTVDLAAGAYKVMLSSASANADFTAEITVITKVIRTLDELVNLSAYGEYTEDATAKTFTLKGFFTLGANIDATGYEFKKYSTWFANDNAEIGLVGGFDGKGYTIYGGTYYQAGLFGSIAKGSVVRNLAISNAAVGYENAGGCIARKNYGTIENCLVDVVAFDARYCQVSAICDLNYGTIANCATSYPLVGTNNDAARAVCEYNLGEGTITNVYAISNDGAVYNAGTGTVEVKTFAYGTKASEITFTGLNEYFDMTGDKIAFKSLADLMDEIEAKKETAAKAFINNVTEETVTLHNGNEAALLDLIEYTAYSVVIDEEYAALVTAENGKVAVSADAKKDFTFDVKYYYTKDETIAKTVTYSVVTTTILNKSVDLFLNSADGDMTFDVAADLGLAAGTEYALALEDETAITFETAGTAITVSGLTAGEYTVMLTVDGDKYQFGAVVITAAISSWEEFIAVRDANTVDGVWNGYYVLDDDVIMPSATYTSSVTAFNGTFDGRGHTIYGGTFHSGSATPTNSLFANLNGTLKNTAFQNNVIGILGGIVLTVNGVVDNCLFDTLRLGNTVYNNQAPINHVAPGGTVQNSIFYVAGGDGSNNDKGAFTMLQGTTINVYVFATKLTGWDNRTNKTGATRYAYDTSLANTNVTGLNSYFDLSGDKATFGFDYDAWYANYIKEQVASIEIEQMELSNGDSITLPALPENVEWAIAYEDASFEGSVIIAEGKLSANAVKVGSFKFTLSAVYTNDANIKKDFEVTVAYIVVFSKTFDLTAEDMTLDLTEDLGITAASEYSLKQTANGEAVKFAVEGTQLTLTLTAGEYGLSLIADGAEIRFKVAVISEIITTADQLAAFAARSNNGYYVLGANIDATGKTFMNTDATFTGTFDGRGYVITNGTFSSANGNKPGGLFGTIETDAVVKNLAITGATLTTEADYNFVYTSVMTGGGQLKGTIEQCYIEITAKGSSTHALGIACHLNGGTIKNVILKSVSGLEKNVCDMVLGSSSISNTYVIGGVATNNGWNQNGSPVSVTKVSTLTAAQQATFNSEYWGFNEGVPYFKKAQA